MLFITKGFIIETLTAIIFIIRMQQEKLEQEHVDIEFKIRKLLNKPGMRVVYALHVQCNTDYPTLEGTSKKMSDDPCCRIIRVKYNK